MGIVDVDLLLRALAPDAPCGPNLEYDPAFLELEQITLGKPEVQYGDTVIPAVPPEWKLVKQGALDLLARTRDLRVAMPLVRALLALHALPGFADGLQLLDGLVDRWWDAVHPQLDPDDANDPTLRINSLSQLVDGATVLRALRDAPCLQLPGLGALTLRLLDQTEGDAPELALASIEAALADVAPVALEAAREAVARAHASAVHLEAALVRHVGATQALDLHALTGALRRMADMLAGPAAVEITSAEPAVGPVPAAHAAVGAGDIASRADVVRMIDRILGYYARSEPSSPVPVLLERAKRLAPMSFMEALENLAPDSLPQLYVIRGPQPERSDH